MPSVIGWDIGGVNTKVARLFGGRILAAHARPFELQHAPDRLAPLLRELATIAGADAGVRHAVTMTAELSQLFRLKRDGVGFVLDAVEAAFPGSGIHVFAVDGRFLTPEEARREPLAVAAANWAATARAVALRHPDALLIDTGTTTTDIIPIVAGTVVADGNTDPERLASGELVYTGAVRTPVEALCSHVPFAGEMVGMSAEGFALTGDVHVWRGDLAAEDYSCPTPDGRPTTREFAGERLARVVCGDRELVNDAAAAAIAEAVAQAQVDRIAAAIQRVVARRASLRTAVVTGLGSFLGEAAARLEGLDVVRLASEVGDAAAKCAPAAAVALLLERELTASPDAGRQRGAARPLSVEKRRSPSIERSASVDIVVKLGGGVLAHREHFDAVLRAIDRVSHQHRLLVVPGGGPFADTVRDVDRRLLLTDEAAHWMAVLAMDQYAHLLAARLARGALVSGPSEIGDALNAGSLPILTPSTWLRDADPLPHTWDVTSDSIAAWVAGEVGARQLVLVKPPGVSIRQSTSADAGGAGERYGDADIVDAWFARVVPEHVTTLIISADQVSALQSLLQAAVG